jgi:pimeloyl-ACP methyl ester carboxylesterase
MPTPEASPPDPDAFEIHRATVRDAAEIAYLREGAGGVPLLLIHGYPETKRIWWRNVAPLAAAGFEVIVPDLRGHGDSGLAADGHYDIAAFSLDCQALVHDVLGHDRCVVAGGDVGGVVLYDLGLRFPGFVDRQVVFNTVPPLLTEAYETAGIPPEPPLHTRPTADYFRRQGTEPDALLAELDTPERRRAWVAAMYGHRLWAARGTFSDEDVVFHSEPYGDSAKLRASWGVYELAFGNRQPEDVPRLFEPTPIPSVVLYGTADNVVPTSFPDRMAVACSECIGPFHLPDAGHFLQWESAELFNRTVRWFCADLLAANRL